MASADGPAVGIVGLGNMGGALADQLVERCPSVVAYDAAGPELVPVGAAPCASTREVARAADVIVLSLPDGDRCEQVAREITEADGRRVRCVIETSTIGVEAARSVAGRLAAAGVAYVDAPVSGGPAGARARTLAMMVAGAADACALAAPVLEALSDRVFHVGEGPGLGQAMKLANNFLSATALAATSEAIAFGREQGLEMESMLEVLAASSGRNSAVDDKFPAHVVTGRYASGFSNALMHKDLELYCRGVSTDAGPGELARATARVWGAFASSEPGVDFTRIYLHVVRDRKGPGVRP